MTGGEMAIGMKHVRVYFNHVKSGIPINPKAVE